MVRQVCEHCGGTGWCPWPVSPSYDLCVYECNGGVCRRCGGTGQVEEIQAVRVTERVSGGAKAPHYEPEQFRLPPGFNPFNKRWRL